MNFVTELCRKLRVNQTAAERVLWDEIRKKNLGQFKFLRQYPIFFISGSGRYFYIADFYCAKQKLVIEVDGPIHDFKKEYDKNRDLATHELGLKVLRFKNDEVINNTRSVVEQIAATLQISIAI